MLKILNQVHKSTSPQNAKNADTIYHRAVNFFWGLISTILRASLVEMNYASNAMPVVERAYSS